MDVFVHSLLRNALFATGLALLPLVVSRHSRSPALVHSLWLLVLLKLITPPLAEVPFSLPANPLRLLKATTDSMTTLESAIPSDHQSWRPVSEPRIPQPIVRATANLRFPMFLSGNQPDLIRPTGSAINFWIFPRWEVIVFATIVSGGVVYWGLAAFRILRFGHMLKLLESAPSDLQGRVKAVARQLGLFCVPRVWLAPGKIPPMLWSFGGQSRLIIPSSLWPDLDEGQQTMLLAHELAHLKRKDHWVRWLDLAVGGLYWWHPIVWWARRKMREVEEQCCDGWALWVIPQGAKTYASALLTALEFISGDPAMRVTPISAVITSNTPISFLTRRMNMIVQANIRRHMSMTSRVGVLILAILILPLTPTLAQKPHSRDFHADHSSLISTVTERQDSSARQVDDKFRDALERKSVAEEGDDENNPDERRFHFNDLAEHVEQLLTDLAETLGKDLGPVGDEVLKALDKAIKDVSDALGEEGIMSKDLRKALETASDELHDAFKPGGPLDEQSHKAAEKAREDMHEAVGRARQELEGSVREQADRVRNLARQGLRTPSEEHKPDTVAGVPEELDQARRQVRQMEQELRRAMRRLDAIERQQERSPRNLRRGPAEVPATPAKPPAPPQPAAAPRPSTPAEAPKVRPVPPIDPSAPVPPGVPRRLRRPLGAGGVMGGPGPLENPRVNARLNLLEEKIDRLLKELESLRAEKKE